MPVAHLTDITVRALKPAPNITYWNQTTPGFGIRVGRQSKTWTIMRGAERERICFGRYPALSVAEARAKAKRLLLEEPESKAIVLTFAAARDLYIEQHTGRFRTKEAKRLTKHFAALDKKALGDVDDADIQKQLDKLKKTPSEALHALRAGRAFFRWCVRPPRRYVKHSARERYEAPHPEKKRDRVLTDEELKKVWEASPPMLRLRDSLLPPAPSLTARCRDRKDIRRPC